MKRAVLKLLALVFCTALFLFPSAAAYADNIDSGTWGNLEWTLDENGLLTITGTGAMVDFEKESTSAWLKREIKNEIKSVTIQYGVTSIGECAFFYCHSLTSISIPESVTSIGKYAFDCCWRLAGVTIPESVTNIGGCAFFNCIALTSVTIPEGVKSIENYAFSYCLKLASVTIPNSVTTIDTGAFSDCRKLTDVYFQGTEEQWNKISIGDNNDPINNATIHCTIIDSGTCGSDGDNLTWTLFDSGLLEIKGNGRMQDFSIWNGKKEQITSVVICEGVTNIGFSAFYSCKNLTEITLPVGLTSIGDSAFSDCSSLKSVTLPADLTSIGDFVFYGCTSLRGIVLPVGLKSIGSAAFYSCNNLTGITFPAGLTGIANSAFFGCTGLKSIMLPDSLTSIDDGAFLRCGGLTSVTIPENVRSIGKKAFYDCGSLTSVTISEGVTSIGESAFDECPRLADVYYRGNVEQWDTISIGDYNDPIKKASIHCAFIDSGTCGAAGDNLTWALYDSGLLEIKGTGRMADSYGASFFSRWNGKREQITSVVIGEGMTYIGVNAFIECNNLTGVTIPKSVTSIGNGAFDNCTSIKSITIPNSVANIGDSAFYNCNVLADVYYDGTQTQWEAISIRSSNEPLLNATLHCRHYVTMDNTITNGSVAADKTDAYEGETITLTVTPETGYGLDTLTVRQGEADISVENYMFTMPTEDVTVTATFKKLQYTITWLKDDGTIIDTTTVEYGTVPTHADVEKEAEGHYTYSFKGWTPEITTVTGAATYKATFRSTVKYTVSFNTDGGTPVPEEQSVEYGSHAVYPEISPKKTGFSFDGWYLGDAPFRFSSTEITDDITLAAKWKANEYVILWLNEDSTMIGTTTVKHGDTPTHDAPVKQADAQYVYAFAGWEPSPQPATETAIYRSSYNKANADITGCDLVLNGTLDLRFYVDLPMGFEDPSAGMSFTIHGRNYTRSMSDVQIIDGKYAFACPVFSIEMAEPVTAVFRYSEGERRKTYSVRNYLESFADDGSKTGNLTVAVRNYGHYMQSYLSGLHNFTVGEGEGFDYQTMPAASAIVPLTELPEYKRVWGPNEYDPNVVGDIQYFDDFDETTTLNIDLALKTGFFSISAKVDGQKWRLYSRGNDTYRISIPGIAANNLGKPWHVEFFVDDEIVYDAYLSALSYVSAVLSAHRDQPGEAEALTAFYEYYKAAKAYE